MLLLVKCICAAKLKLDFDMKHSLKSINIRVDSCLVVKQFENRNTNYFAVYILNYSLLYFLICIKYQSIQYTYCIRFSRKTRFKIGNKDVAIIFLCFIYRNKY